MPNRLSGSTWIARNFPCGVRTPSRQPADEVVRLEPVLQP